MSTLTRPAGRSITADALEVLDDGRVRPFDGLGVLEEGSNTYLWEGQIVEPMPEYQPHWNAVCEPVSIS